MGTWRQRFRVWADPAVAAVLVLAAVAELRLSLAGAEPWRLAAAVLGTAPLAVRTRFPLPVLLLTVAALSVLTAARSDWFSVAQLLGLMLATYSVAAHSRPPVAGAGLGVVLAAAYANSLATGRAEAGDYVFASILLTVPWLAGIGLRRWRERAAELTALAAQLAAEREQHARLVVAAERGRIARDLHDSLAQTLNAVVVHAEAAQEALGRDDERVRRSLERIGEVARESLGETRRLLGALRGDGEEPRPPRLADLDRLVAAYRAEGMRVELDHRGDPRPLSHAVDAAAYRIVQEALTNAARHAPGSLVRVVLEYGEDLRGAVRDDGGSGGPHRRVEASGYGLLGMRERALLLGGDLLTGPDGSGFLVSARLPGGGAA